MSKLSRQAKREQARQLGHKFFSKKPSLWKWLFLWFKFRNK